MGWARVGLMQTLALTPALPRHPTPVATGEGPGVRASKGSTVLQAALEPTASTP